MTRENYLSSCCCEEHKNNCMICGKPLHYFPREMMFECFVCHKIKAGNAICEAGHFVCDECHSGDSNAVLHLLRNTKEKDPVLLLEQIFRLSSVHMHGPEHHSIVPCVLVTVYHNCGGDIDFESCLEEAWKRGQKMIGGSCGYLGVCGAAAGAGIFASIVSGATPLTEKEWIIPQRLVAQCLNKNVETGGPRCCKRTSRIALECAVEYAKEVFDVTIPVSKTSCIYSSCNNECIKERCPYYPK